MSRALGDDRRTFGVTNDFHQAEKYVGKPEHLGQSIRGFHGWQLEVNFGPNSMSQLA